MARQYTLKYPGRYAWQDEVTVDGRNRPVEVTVRRLEDTGRWTVDIELADTDGVMLTAGDETYRTKAEARAYALRLVGWPWSKLYGGGYALGSAE